MDFRESLKIGQAAESMISLYLRNRGCTILPVYEKIIDEGKGPQLFLPGGDELVAPDLLVYKGSIVRWIEAKRKTAFTWHRKTQSWNTGIDLRHYEHYIKIDEESPFPVWLYFLHSGGQAKDSPAQSPSGLFTNSLQILKHNEHHRHENWAKGMVYWDIKTLIKIAEYSDIFKQAS